MDKPEIVKIWCLSHVGCPYIYGGTGQICTVEYRRARAAQYPEKAAKIKNSCPRLSGATKSCPGCPWFDAALGQGKRAYDCAQLSRFAMEAVGIPMVSGANSQWQKTAWAERGPMADLPRDKVCLVFRNDGDTMGHVGVYTGDGCVIHAKGHDWGVMRQRLEDTAFTHYGVPAALYDGKPALPILRQGASGAEVESLQSLLRGAGEALAIDGRFGPDTEKAVRAFQRRSGLAVDGVAGPCTWAALQADAPPQGAALSPVPGEDAPGGAAPALLDAADWAALRRAWTALGDVLSKHDAAC